MERAASSIGQPGAAGADRLEELGHVSRDWTSVFALDDPPLAAVARDDATVVGTNTVSFSP